MSFEEYKKIHVLFSDGNPKSQLSLEIKTNPNDEMDVKVKLNIFHEFRIKEFNDNSVMLNFKIDCCSLTNEIKNEFKYILPDEMTKESKIENSNENEIINSRKDMILIEKNQNNEMILSRRKLIKNDIVTDNENNLMINSKKYYIFADQINRKKQESDVNKDDTEIKMSSVTEI